MKKKCMTDAGYSLCIQPPAEGEGGQIYTGNNGPGKQISKILRE